MANLPLAAAVNSLVEGGNINSIQIPAAVKEEELSEAMETDVRLGKQPCEAPEVGSEAVPHEAQFQFLKTSYIDELGSLSSAIRIFQFRLNELQDHICFIHNAIGERSKQCISSLNSQQDTNREPLSVRDTKIALVSNSSTIVATVDSGRLPVSSSSPLSRSPRSNIPKTSSDWGNIDGKESIEKQSPSSALSELEHLCQTMCSRGLRKYIVSHLSDLANLRHEIPLALKYAPKPAKLVFDCIGRFYLQGSKAFSKDSPMIPAREASILILELFLLSGATEADNDRTTEIEPSLKAEAGLAAIAWRKRLINESGSCQTSDIDARGLLLFLASFGIPTVFTNDDLRDLLRSSNSKGIADALRRSRGLCTRIPDIIKGMTKNGMNVEAVDVVYAFGLEDVFPPQEILLSFLQKCDEAWKRRINDVRGSTMQLRRVNEEKLGSLKCVLKCLEDHKIDPVKFLPGWRIHEMIINLEKDISEFDKRMEEKASLKRRTDETSMHKYQSHERKRWRMPSKGFPDMSCRINGLMEQNAATFLEDRTCFTTTSSSSMPQKLLDGGGRAALLSNYQIASSLQGPGLVDNTVLPAETSAGSFPRGIEMGMVRDDNGEASIYKTMSTKPVGQSIIRQAMSMPTPSMESSYSAIERFGGLATTEHLDLYHFADSAVFESDAPKSNSTPTAALPRRWLPHQHHPPYFYN